MANLTLKDVPDSVYRPLADRAARRGTTVEEEARECLEAALRDELAADAQVGERLRAIRGFRESLGAIFVTQEELERAEREGRD